MEKVEKGKYKVFWKNRVKKRIEKCPAYVQKKFKLLVEDLCARGAILPEWDRFSALGKNFYHCHLDYSWAAVWYWEKDSIVVEVTYVGSRESTPY